MSSRLLVVAAVPAELPAPAAGVTILAGGIGPVEAALSAAAALTREAYAAVVAIGIGGSFDEQRAPLGSVVVIDEEVLAELGVEGDGAIALPPGTVLESRVSADPALVQRARAALPGVAVGRGVTVATVTASSARARELSRRFDPLLESMEGFAVLRAAQRAGVRALELRAVSNLVGVRDRAAWNLRGALDALHLAWERLREHLP